ncbi:phosphoribosylanthranilate isomerase [Euryhalocaulis caribicus]|uniref:phosphoribosylanthranilate isomerase n=1 Tax=Euryhalocaulis caribicus TaxID=1161401 RepID=UPI0003B48158|nr:phosphoribosylanthranilate isomerase [Euryhalocaulis caribicus]
MARVKICGLTREEDVRGAARAGAEFCGFLLAESPRRVSLERGAELARQARDEGLKTVAVLVNPNDAALTAIAAADAFDAIQLHGDEPPSRALQAGRLTGTAVIKVLTGGSAAAEAYASVDGFLFDAPVKPGERRGGHGRAFDWDALDTSGVDKPWFLAGGLNPDNVAEAISRTGAPAVDVSSGVEDAPGVKNADLMRWFVDAARQES